VKEWRVKQTTPLYVLARSQLGTHRTSTSTIRRSMQPRSTAEFDRRNRLTTSDIPRNVCTGRHQRACTVRAHNKTNHTTYLRMPECSRTSLPLVFQHEERAMSSVFERKRCVASRFEGRSVQDPHICGFSAGRSAAMAAKSETRAAVWHKRLGHAPLRTIRKMLADKMVEGLDVNDEELKALGEAHCGSCTRAKQHRRSFPISRSTTSAPMERVHSDVMVMPTVSRQGAKYVSTLLDDFSKASYVECIRRKSDVPEVLRKRLLYLETVTGRATKMVRSDNGGEYTATSLRTFFEQRGILHQFTAPYTPEQNGKAERLNRTLAETTRAMLFSSKVSHDLWDEGMVVVLSRLHVKECIPLVFQHSTALSMPGTTLCSQAHPILPT
jgi:transposase InsO family protein